MAIKKLNATDPGVKRPVRCSDFQDIWTGLCESLASGTIGSTTPQIISGLTVDSENDYALTSGLLAYNGMLYYFDSTEATINEGDPIYAGYIADADRNFSDSSVQPFSYSYVLRNASTGLTDAVNIGQCTISNLAAWRVSGIPDASIPSEKLGQIPVTKIAQNSLRYSTELSEVCVANETLIINAPASDSALYNVGIRFQDQSFGSFRVIVKANSDGNIGLQSTRLSKPMSPYPVGALNIKAGSAYEISYTLVAPEDYITTIKELDIFYTNAQE